MKTPLLPILAATAASLIAGASATAQERALPFVVVGSNAGFERLQDAIGLIGDGKGTILVEPGTYRECAVQEMGDITIAARTAGTVIFDGVTCEGKAALVLRGRASAIDGIIFQNMRVPDGNGAGIRMEHGNLTVTNTMFRNSEQGVLSHDDPRATISFDRSTFSHLGRCDRDLSCAHSIYIGNYGRLIVTRSRFEAGDGGHYVKTRSAVAEIRDNSFDDSQGRTTNYMIDLPAASTGIITGNEMVQGRDKENYSAFIAVGAEERQHSANGLRVENNSASFVPGLQRNSTFVADWTGDRIAIGKNQLAPGIKITDRR